MAWKAILTIAVISIVTVAVVLRVPQLRGIVFGTTNTAS